MIWYDLGSFISKGTKLLLSFVFVYLKSTKIAWTKISEFPRGTPKALASATLSRSSSLRPVLSVPL